MRRTSLTATGAILFILLGTAACNKRHPDPTYLDIGDFETGKPLTDTIKGLGVVGMKSSKVWEMMQRSGFKCAERSPEIIKYDDKTLVNGKQRLECYHSSPFQLGFRRRDWTVTFNLDSSSRVSDLYSSYFIQNWGL